MAHGTPLKHRQLKAQQLTACSRMKSQHFFKTYHNSDVINSSISIPKLNIKVVITSKIMNNSNCPWIVPVCPVQLKVQTSKLPQRPYMIRTEKNNNIIIETEIFRSSLIRACSVIFFFFFVNPKWQNHFVKILKIYNDSRFTIIYWSVPPLRLNYGKSSEQLPKSLFYWTKPC